MMRNDPLNAFVDSKGPAIETLARGPLSGCTLAVKDIFDVAGHKTGCGNPDKQAGTAPAKTTAPAVQMLLDAGASFIGKTQTDELAFSLTGQNAHFPRAINPAAPDRVTGGSSSGSAAAVAGGLTDIATGSDTGGSIRAPASYCGLVGLRTTHGLIPLDGTMPLAESFDVFGWFARDIDLYIQVAELLLPPAASKPSRLIRLDEQETLLAGTREMDAYRRAIRDVHELLGNADDKTLTSLDVEARYWCLRKTQAFEAWRNHGTWIAGADRRLGPGIKERFAYGETISADIYDAEIMKRAALRSELEDLLGNDGLIVMPTVPGAAPLAAASFDDLQDYRERAIRLLCLSGLTGLPQLTLPIAHVDGAPLGISLLGPGGSDLALLALGRTIMNLAVANGE
ncbi:amidase [Hoeflea prorocentri]|uniref:Amidase n=1 Tax=Hoeflea prorocentri TaxID=1922333 RepID=A0A9X3UER3_9HYPH|nr:amidase [Hoeflea prorocentri]MCY6379189.1 amidase [Hoeflea prorocentri]MDA5396990.1 amidase [Hoeflea prorocentri]